MSKIVENIPALRILEDGRLEHTTLATIDGSYTDGYGMLTATDRTAQIMGWGAMDGACRALLNEWGNETHYVRVA